MCVAFLNHCPRVTYLGYPFACGYELETGICDSGWDQADLANVGDLNRTFGLPAGTCTAAPDVPTLAPTPTSTIVGVPTVGSDFSSVSAPTSRPLPSGVMLLIVMMMMINH